MYEPFRSVHESRKRRRLIRPRPPSSQSITGSAYSCTDAVKITTWYQEATLRRK